jgi:hypothetical protein
MATATSESAPQEIRFKSSITLADWLVIICFFILYVYFFKYYKNSLLLRLGIFATFLIIIQYMQNKRVAHVRLTISANELTYWDRRGQMSKWPWGRVEKVIVHTSVWGAPHLTLVLAGAITSETTELHLPVAADIPTDDLAEILIAHADLPYYHETGSRNRGDEIWSRTPEADENA